MSKIPREMKLSELAARSKTPARTIRLYISLGLLHGPLRPGRNAAYGPEHLERLARIRALQQSGMTLSQAREALEEGDGGAPLPPSESWRRYDLAPDVQVVVREDIAPWRARALRQAIQQFSRWVNTAEETKEQQDE
jgi:DNA-binding transcriptional MerR regulator